MKFRNIPSFLILFLLLVKFSNGQNIANFMSDTTRPGSYMISSAPDYNNGFILLSESPDSSFSLNVSRFTFNRYDRNGSFLSSYANDELHTKRCLLTSDHGYLFTSHAINSQGQIIFKMDSLFNIQWSKKVKPIELSWTRSLSRGNLVEFGKPSLSAVTK